RPAGEQPQGRGSRQEIERPGGAEGQARPEERQERERPGQGAERRAHRVDAVERRDRRSRGRAPLDRGADGDGEGGSHGDGRRRQDEERQEETESQNWNAV